MRFASRTMNDLNAGGVVFSNTRSPRCANITASLRHPAIRSTSALTAFTLSGPGYTFPVERRFADPTTDSRPSVPDSMSPSRAAVFAENASHSTTHIARTATADTPPTAAKAILDLLI